MMEKQNTKIIVVGGNHVNTLGLIRSLGKNGYPIVLLLEHCRLDWCNLRFSKYISKMYYMDVLEDILSILHKDYWDEESKPVVLCASDASICFLDQHYDELKEHFFIFNINGQQGMINHYMNKWNTFPIAKKSGFSVIKSCRVRTLGDIPADIHYPCLIKGNSSISSLKTDMFKCESEEELRGNFHEGVDLLLQEYIEKDYEIDVVGFAYNHGQDTIVAGAVRKIRDDLQRQSVYIRLDDINDYPKQVRESISLFMKEIKYDGIFSIELLCKGNRFYFLEINLRNDGNGYLYTAAGANYPLCWVKYCQGTLTQEYAKSMRVKHPYYLMQFIDIYNVFEGKVGFLKWLYQGFTANAYYTLDLSDPKPFLYSAMVRITHFCKKLLRHLRIVR